MACECSPALHAVKEPGTTWECWRCLQGCLSVSSQPSTYVYQQHWEGLHFESQCPSPPHSYIQELGGEETVSVN